MYGHQTELKQALDALSNKLRDESEEKVFLKILTAKDS